MPADDSDTRPLLTVPDFAREKRISLQGSWILTETFPAPAVLWHRQLPAQLRLSALPASVGIST